MTARQKIILIGGFGEIIELCEAIGVVPIGILDANLSGSYGDCPVLGTDEQAASILAEHRGIPVHVTPDAPAVRRRITQRYRELGAGILTLVHPTATVAPTVRMGEGCAIQAGANLSSHTQLGRGVKVNTCANVTHDVLVGDFVTIAPSACILGKVRIGPEAYVGANATILPGLSIGEGAVIGAGSVVTHDVQPHVTIAGNPARPI